MPALPWPPLPPALLQDRHFDSIVGALEEAVMDPTFADLQQTFVDEWCGE